MTPDVPIRHDRTGCGAAQTRAVRRIGIVAVAATFLAGCSSGMPKLPSVDSLNPFKEEKQPLPGERISILPDSDRVGGAELATGSLPVALPAPRGVEVVPVETAEQMHAATHAVIADVDIFIAAAAVSDYRPAGISAQKIKKTRDTMILELERSPDILASVASLEAAPFTVGFAAETENVREYALGKLVNKKLDMIVANRVGADCGFDYDDNAAELLWNGGDKVFAKMPKSELAAGLMDVIAAHFLELRGAGLQPTLSVVSTTE